MVASSRACSSFSSQFLQPDRHPQRVLGLVGQVDRIGLDDRVFHRPLIEAAQGTQPPGDGGRARNGPVTNSSTARDRCPSWPAAGRRSFPQTGSGEGSVGTLRVPCFHYTIIMSDSNPHPASATASPLALNPALISSSNVTCHHVFLNEKGQRRGRGRDS